MYFFSSLTSQNLGVFLNKQLLDLYVKGNAMGITLKFDTTAK